MSACNCPAYRFPHRHGGGKCSSPVEVASSDLASRPNCAACEYGTTEKDPYGTGDHWFSLTDCRLDYCIWEKSK